VIAALQAGAIQDDVLQQQFGFGSVEFFEQFKFVGKFPFVE
jgi:hypothetical protein